MARSPIEIAIASETKAFKQGILTGIIDPLEDAIKKLRDLGDTDGADKLERELKAAQHATENLSDETKRTAAAIEREYRDAYRAAKKAADEGLDTKGFSKASEAAGEFKSEALQNFSEVTSSFDGSMSSIGDLAQGTLGGLASSLPGIGLIAGGAAVGVGLITSAIEGVNEATEESKARAAEWAQAFIDSGSMIVGAAHTVAEVQAIATDPERYQQAKDNAKNWGIDVSTAMLAMAGNATALGVAQDGLDRTAQKYKDTTDKVSQAALELNNRWNAGKDKLAELNGEMQQGREAASNVSDSLLKLVEGAANAGVEVDSLGNQVVNLPDGTSIFIDAQTKQASQNIDKFKGDTDGVIDQLNGRDVVLKVRADLAAANTAFDVLQKRASKGFDIAFNPTGRQLLQ